jgi:hypothetical protein
MGSQRRLGPEPRRGRPTGVRARCPSRHLPLPDTTFRVLSSLESEVDDRRIRTGVWAEMARILHRTRPYCTVRAIAEVYVLARGTSDGLIIPGSWVRAPPAPPAGQSGWCVVDQARQQHIHAHVRPGTADNDCADDMRGTLAAITSSCPAVERSVTWISQPSGWRVYFPGTEDSQIALWRSPHATPGSADLTGGDDPGPRT